jgi:hypothetical protein
LKLPFFIGVVAADYPDHFSVAAGRAAWTASLVLSSALFG